MSEYPRAEAPPAVFPPFVYDRVFAALRGMALLYGSFGYFTAFHARWERYAPDLSIFAYAPPLGSHLTSQIVGVFSIALIVAGLWSGRGWAFAYSLLGAIGGCALAFVGHQTTPRLVFFGAVELPSFLYCGLRLIGTFGPPTGGLELRRLVSGR